MSRRLDTAVIGALAVFGCTAAILVGCSATNAPSQAWENTPDNYKTAIADAVAEHGCDRVTQDLVAAQTGVESDFYADAVSAAGAEGPAQIHPAQWSVYAPRVNATNPHDPSDAMAVLVAIDCDAAAALAAGGVAADAETIAAAYNSGTSTVIANPTELQPETQKYVQRVTSLLQP